MGTALRAGIIGSGNTGRLHAQGYLHAGATVACCAGQGGERARALAATYGCDWTDNYRRLLERSDIDVVSVCTPTWTHQEIALAVLAAGKHILCEKPITQGPAACAPLVRMVASTGLTFQAGYMKWHHPLTQRLVELVAQIQPLQTARVRTYYPVPLERWERLQLTRDRQGGGALMLSGSHILAVQCLLLGYPLQAMPMMNWQPTLTGIDRYTAALFRQPDGVIVSFEAGWLPLTNVGIDHTGWEEIIELNGAGGRLEIHYPWWNRTETSAARLLLHSNADGQTHEFHATPASQFDAEVAAFVRAVEGGQPPTPSVIDAYRIHALIDQLYAAGTREQAVTFDYGLPG
jgi:predicted dehydrogenase